MVHEYSELKGLVKFGDRVRAVPGKNNVCIKLNDDGSNECRITDVNDTGFRIDGCVHGFSEGCYLDLIEKTLDSLAEGDVVVDNIGRRTVLGVCGRVYLMSTRDYQDRFGVGYTAKELRSAGYRPVEPTPVPETVEVLGKVYRRTDVEASLAELGEAQQVSREAN